MKAIWKGSISFGLVNIPIKLYSAIEAQATKFRLLHKKTLTPIKYKKWNDEAGEEVAWEDIVKGVETAKDTFVVFTPKELEAIKPEKTQRIEVVEFTDAHQVDPIYFDAHYYVAPEKAKEKTFFLFKEILQQTAKVAIGTFVMREKEYVCAIESYSDGLLLTTLNYSYEIRDMKGIEELSQKPKLTKQEIELARQLVDKIYVDEFDMHKFKDTFATSLKALVKKKEKGELITIEVKEKPATKEKDLIAALKASLR